MGSILVVEESFAVRSMIEGALNVDGHTLTSVPSGERAVQMVNSAVYDLMILDLNLPDADALSAMREWRGRPMWERTPILVLAEPGQDELRRKAMSWGATGHMLKPIRPSELIQKVQKLLEATR